jgi:hypothetical protein
LAVGLVLKGRPAGLELAGSIVSGQLNLAAGLVVAGWAVAGCSGVLSSIKGRALQWSPAFFVISF